VSDETNVAHEDQITLDDRIQIQGRDGSFGAYIARPASLPAPAVVVLHEVFGVNADIREHCDRLADQGFVAVAPDLFWRLESDVDLSVTSQADWDHGVRLYQKFDRDAGARDAEDVVKTVAGLPQCTGKVSLLGYCLGGLMTFLTAARSKVDAAVAFHGGETEKYLQEADRLDAPLLMHLAGQNEFMSMEAQSEMKAALTGKLNVAIYSYPGQYHAFSRIRACAPITKILGTAWVATVHLLDLWEDIAGRDADVQPGGRHFERVGTKLRAASVGMPGHHLCVMGTRYAASRRRIEADRAERMRSISLSSF